MNPNLTNLGPVLGAVLRAANWPRNELRYQLDGLAPMVTPFVVPETPDATTVRGTLNAATQIGDPIRVEVIAAPSYGTVTVTPEGFFAYTPEEALAGAPGADKFTVKVTDAGFHFGRNLGISGHSTTADVTVSWQDLTPPPPGSSDYYGFHIYNYTGYTLTVSGLGDQQATTQSPTVGTVIPQGEYTFVQMENCGCGKDKESTFYFDATGAGVAGIGPDNSTYPDYKANTKVAYEYNGAYYYTTKTSCNAYSGSCDPDNDGNIYLYDSPGTNFYLPGTTAQEIDTQNNVINQFVADDGSNVTFINPTSSIGYTPLTTVSGIPPLGCPAYSTCYLQISQSDSVSRTAGHTDTVGVSVDLGTGQESAVNLQVTASYERAWDKSVTTESTTAVTYVDQVPGYGVRPQNYGYTVYTFQASPVVYTSGTTTVTQWNDSYNLADTWYTFPNYDPSLPYNAYVEFITCPTGGAACTSLAEGIVPAGYNFFNDPNDPNDPGYQECTTDCDVPYNLSGGTDPVTGLTLLNLVSNTFPTYYLTAPVGTALADSVGTIPPQEPS